MQPPVVTTLRTPARPAARALWQASRTASDEGRWSTGLALAQRALREADRQPGTDPVLRARILIALAYDHSELGDPQRARDLLREAADCPEVLPAVWVARGLTHVRTGRPDAALVDPDAAVAQLRTQDSAEALEDLAGALVNRGLLHMVAGRLPEAAADTEAAGVLARRIDRGDITFMAEHNLGFVRYLAGDLPAALAAMDAAAPAWSPAVEDGVAQLDRAKVLVDAGLADAAAEQLDRAVDFFRAQRATADLVDAYYVRAQLELLRGQPGSAAASARAAEQIARRRGNVSAEITARALRLQAARGRRQQLAGTSTPRRRAGLARRDAAAAAAVSVEADAAGLTQEARAAVLLQAEALLDAGDVESARGVAAAARRRPGTARLATRMQSRYVDARLALASGRRSAGLAHIRRGLDELSQFRATFGSQDLQATSSVHGRDLARLGLRTAVEIGSPAAILQWLERARGVSTRLPAVRPPADPDFARELGAFRATFQQARQAVLSGRRDPALEARLRERRRRLQAMAWTAGGSGAVQQPPTLADVQARLRTDPAQPVVLAYLRGDGALHALVITGRHAWFRRLGAFDLLAEQIRRVGGDLDLLAAHRIPAPVRQVARRSLGAGLDAVTAAMLDPLQALLGTGPLLIAGAGMLTTVPWGLLPPLRGRPVSVTASVTAALADRPPGATPVGTRPAAARLLAVAGPGLPHAVAEAEQGAALHPGATLLVGSAATGADTLAQLPDRGLLHIAAHGHHERESPLFSWVQLADGPLYGYDIAPNPQLPDHVVLSSCDVGRSDDRPGGEPLGLAAALLRSGVSTVVAGTSRLSDEVAASSMVAYHRRLLAGDAPAVALAAAVGDVDGIPVPLTCFGIGGTATPPRRTD